MALIIETGERVAGANSYVTVSEARAYATARGVTLPTDDSAVEVLLLKATDYLESKRSLYQGYKATERQPLQWPRYWVVIDGYDVDSDSIPQLLKDAQCQLAIEVNSTDLMPTDTGKEVIRRKIDVIEVEYARTGRNTSAPSMPKVEALLRPLYKTSGLGINLIRA